MSSDTFFRRSFLARLPNTNINASMRFDLPDPFGPTTEVKRLCIGPISRTPAYDLKFSKVIFCTINLCEEPVWTAGVRRGAADGLAAEENGLAAGVEADGGRLRMMEEEETEAGWIAGDDSGEEATSRASSRSESSSGEEGGEGMMGFGVLKGRGKAEEKM